MSGERGSGGQALLVAAGILASRVSGLVRESVFAHFFGNSPAAGAFKAALRIPNFLQNLFGEGVLSASFIPVYARLLAEGRRELAGRVAGVVGAVLGLGVSVVVALGVFATPWIVDLVAPGFSGGVRDLTVVLVRILFPGVGLLVLSAWCLGILNSHGRFFLSYVAPVLWNAAMIATLLLFGARRGQEALAVALAWGTVAGSALQLGVQVPFVLRHARPLRLALRLELGTRLEPVREVFRNLAPVVAGRGVVQVSAYVDEIIASFLGASAFASLAYAQTIYLLPISLFGMSVAAAELPRMSSATGSAAEVGEAVRRRVEGGLAQVAFFVVPTTLAFLLLGDLLVGALYQRGRFGAEDTRYVWYILAGSAVGLLAAAQGRLFASAFYALRDTRTPFRIALLRVALTAFLGWLFAFPLRPALVAAALRLGVPLPAVPGGALALGAVGLTASAGLAAWIELALLRRALGRRLGAARVAPSRQARVWAAALVAAAAGLAARRFAPGLPLPGGLASVGRALPPVAAFGLAYLGAAAALGLPEVRRLARLWRR